MKLKGDFGREAFKEVGKLSSMLPSYIRHCCRALYDGTDATVLEAYREIAYKVLLDYSNDYPFVPKHLEILRIYDPVKIQDVIMSHKTEDRKTALYCLATSTALGLPKRACLHCPKVSGWMKQIQAGGTIDEQTGERRDYK